MKMASRGRSTSPRRASSARHSSHDDALFDPRPLEAFGRTVHATAAQLIQANFTSSSTNSNNHNHNNNNNDASGSGGNGASDPYRHAMSSVHRTLRRPAIQRSVFSFAQASPRELLRGKFNTSELEQKALSYIPEELIRAAPASNAPFTLFDGFRASLPEDSEDDGRGGRRKKGAHGRHGSRLLLEGGQEDTGPPQLASMKREKERRDRRLEMMGIRKTMAASEIREIDAKIANLNTMRKLVLDRLAGLEGEEHALEQEIAELAEKVAEIQEQLEDEAALAAQSPALAKEGEEARHDAERVAEEQQEQDAADGFMSESIYEKLPKTSASPKSKRRTRMPRRTISMRVLHEHMEPGSRIRELQAHNDMITALDFDAPFGTMVTAALDDTVRVWDLNAGRCMGMLEGHLSSVRCLQVEDNLVATGSMDASIRLWDLSQADYNPSQPPVKESSALSSSAEARSQEDDEDTSLFTTREPNRNAMADTPLHTLSAHVAEITALHFHNNTLVSGSADKTLRQWDLEKGRCVQTLDVMWAAAQASTLNPGSTTNGVQPVLMDTGRWSRLRGGGEGQAEADFVGALQVFDAALACGTADGMVRLWDLRSGVVSRSLVGHTGPVTALQFDDVFLVTAARDRSIRVSCALY